MRMIGLLLALVEWMRLLTIPIVLVAAGVLIACGAIGQGRNGAWLLAGTFGVIAFPIAAYGAETALKSVRRRAAQREATDGEGEPL